MTAMLHRLQHLLIIATGLAAVVLAGMWSPYAGAGLLAFEAVAFMVALRRGFFTVPDTKPQQPINAELAARTMVTHMLKGLTRVQVAYLCRDFSSKSRSRAWLKKALPKAFQGSLDELHRNLEKARLGAEVESLRLAQRIVSYREQIRTMVKDLEQAADEHGHSIGHPMFFVITEHLDADHNTEPKVVTLAGWNPTETTLLPYVDGITFYSDLDAGKKIRGQADFDQVLEAMPDQIQPLEPHSKTYLAQPVEDPGNLAVRLDKVPMGFTVGTEDML